MKSKQSQGRFGLRRMVSISVLLGGLAYFWFHDRSDGPKPLYRYEDERGIHFVDSLDKVPAEHRERAERVDEKLPAIGRGDYEKYHDAVGGSSPRKGRRSSFDQDGSETGLVSAIPRRSVTEPRSFRVAARFRGWQA